MLSGNFPTLNTLSKTCSFTGKQNTQEKIISANSTHLRHFVIIM